MMTVRRWHKKRLRELQWRQPVVALLTGVCLIILGTTYLTPLPGWSAGIDRESALQPLVLVKASRAWFLVDEKGMVRGALAHDRRLELPQLHGIDSRALLHQEFSAVNATRNGNELATLLLEFYSDDHQLRDDAIQLDFSNPQNIVAAFNDTTVHFGRNDFQEQWKRVMHVRAVGAVSLSAGHELDLRFPRTVIVREIQ